MDSSAVSYLDWAGLPKHLLDKFLEKLVPFSADFVRFSAVCLQWNRVTDEYRKQLGKRLDLQVPLLLFPKTERPIGELKNLYNVTTKEFVNLEVRVPSSKRYGGSSRGWLITIDKDFVVTLINPFAPPKAVITLPPLRKEDDLYYHHIRKAVLSADPTTTPKNYTVAVLYGINCQLALINPGREDACWIYSDRIWYGCDDIIYYKGLLHAVDSHGKVFFFYDNSFLPQQLSPRPKQSPMDKSYLVESVRGDLLVVYRDCDFFFDNPITKYRVTKHFEIYKFDPNGPRWVEMKNLGGESLFLGDNMSLSVLASLFRGCSPNSIYFTHDCDFCMAFGTCGNTDSGVFNLENSSITPHYVMDEALLSDICEQPPIWFVPNFFSP